MLPSLFESSRATKRLLSVCFDTLAILCAFYFANCMRLGTLTPPFGFNELLMITNTAVLSIIVFIRMGMYRAF